MAKGRRRSARRDGIDDLRYLQMLEDRVAASPDSPVAALAGGWLEGLRSRINFAPEPQKTRPGVPLDWRGHTGTAAMRSDVRPIPDVVLRARGVVKVHGTGRGQRRVLDGVDLEIRRGEVVCVLGPSGSGKSTLLRCINLLAPP